jgi:hypothetical protein
MHPTAAARAERRSCAGAQRARGGVASNFNKNGNENEGMA